ncbi:MAG TPA: glycosyltransferase family 2 protein [Candidatus Blautia stercoravium]|nr:glycosyltransferase family 2 protein [Candidatus Blautia stercoravium]
MTVTVIVPTYKPDGKFLQLMNMLKRQTCKADQILIMNTEERYWKNSFMEGVDNWEVHHLSRTAFDHGKTRGEGAKFADSEILVYFTQDAVPVDEKLLENLLEPFRNPQVGAAYARQLPADDCKIIERYTRSFNYPDTSRIKTKKDIPELGIKTYFCSNVCAAYRRSVYEEMGGFVTRTIFNEDMIMASQMIQAGYGVAYAAEARVVHSHNYGYMQQLRRNFDLAVSQEDHPEIFASISSESEGIRLVKSTAVYLIKQGKPWLIPDLILSSGFKYLGYKAGRSYKRLPSSWVRRLTMNPAYWEKR